MKTFIIEVFDDLTCLKEEVSAMLNDMYDECDLVLSKEDWNGHVAYALGCLIFSLTHIDGLSYHSLTADMLKFYRTNVKLRGRHPSYDKVCEFAELILDAQPSKAIQKRLKSAVGNYLHDRASIETEVSITQRRLIVKVDL